MSQRHPSTCTQTPTIYTRTANSAAIGSASTTATRPAGGAHISTLHGQQRCPRKLNRSSRDFRLPVEKEAGGWRLGQSKVSLSSEGCSRGERPNYAPQGAWGRHPVTGAGMANFLVTQPDAAPASLDRWPAMRAFPHGGILSSSGSFGASVVCSRSSFSNPTMSSPMSSPICTFRNAASNASRPIMS